MDDGADGVQTRPALVRQSDTMSRIPRRRSGGLVEDFLEFIDETPHQSVREVADRVLSRCRMLTGAEAGTVFMLRGGGEEPWLETVSVQNDVLQTTEIDFTVPVNGGSIAGYVAATGRTLFVDDAYAIPEEWPFHFNPAFDHKSGFRTRSILCFALFSYSQRTIGVVQLINRRIPQGDIGPFLSDHEAMIAPVNHLVGRAVERIDSIEQIARQNRLLEQRNAELCAARARAELLRQETERAFMATVELLGRAAERHDVDTGNHIRRVNAYSARLAELAGMPADFCEQIGALAALHDVGKMAVDKAILHKPGRLADHEVAEIRCHTIYGYDILSIHDRMTMAAEIAYSHHEKWDGSGYPRGLAGEDIPLSARIVAICDVYDALRSSRPYKAGLDHGEAVRIMTEGDDRIDPPRHFDPRLLAVFLAHHSDFAAIWDRLVDEAAVADPDHLGLR